MLDQQKSSESLVIVVSTKMDILPIPCHPLDRMSRTIAESKLMTNKNLYSINWFHSNFLQIADGYNLRVTQKNFCVSHDPFSKWLLLLYRIQIIPIDISIGFKELLWEWALTAKLLAIKIWGLAIKRLINGTVAEIKKCSEFINRSLLLGALIKQIYCT